jgi:hypothetical protein
LLAVTPDELDDYERVIDRDEAVVLELENERELSDGDELTDVTAEPDETFFDRTRWTYSGCNGHTDGDGEVDVRELKSVGALLDDPDDDGDDTDDADD